ncbi:hypothetical protein KSS87_008058 [Heliosperma pusillum]|nr:hypothetical protein KSS87_018746 [Heliosperma pusillum]KAH9618771.1 hypothetical protein KSS87_008058 [Heliosperma pusillum]
MVVLIAELFQNLLSKDGQGKITTEEWNFFMNWRAKTLKSAATQGSIASTLVFIGTRKLNRINRFLLCGGNYGSPFLFCAGLTAGYWTFQKSYRTCVDQILGLDGTRMQNELKKIVLQRYGNDPGRMRAFSKHFYGEELYSDSSPEYPKLVYRQRHVFMDNPKGTVENVYGVSDSDGQQRDHQRIVDRNPPKVNGPIMENKQVRTNPGISAYGYGDPLEVLFGYALANDNIEQPEASGEAPKVQSRKQKRVRRKQQMRQRHREALSPGLPQLLSL